MGTLRSGLSGWLRGTIAAALLGLSLGLAAAIGPAEADKVGVAAAVNPDAFSSLAGSPQSQLNIGKSIFFNERINTTTSGLVQVLLVDGSTFTVGPDSDLVIDKFVYDPNKGTGQIAASFSKGVMRFVGGKISKSDNAVSIKTPAGALAVRGCIVLTQVTATSLAAVLVYGDYIKLKNLVAYEPGNGIFSSPNGIVVKQAPPGFVASLMSEFANSNTQANNNAQTKTANPSTVFKMVNTQSLNQLINNANTSQILGDADKGLDTQVAPPCQVDCGTPPGHLQGYAAGLYFQNTVDEGDSPVGVLANQSAKDVDFDFTQGNQTFSALFKLRVGEPGSNQGGIDIKFGDTTSNPDPPHSSINASGFAALSAPNGITVYHDDQTPAKLNGEPPSAALVSSGYLPEVPASTHAEEQTPPPLPEFCTDCTFMEWGAVVADASFDDTNGQGVTTQRDVTILGWWVAGDIPAVGDLPFMGSATYSGSAIGTVWNDRVYDPCSETGYTTSTYTATGDMNMTWDFKSRSGNLEISHFDQQHFPDDGGLSFSGNMCAPGVTSCGTSTPSGNHFGGALHGQLPASTELPADARNLDGFALGSFARGPNNYNNGDPKTGTPIKGSTPQGVMGNWAVGNDHYKASGVFAGTQVGPTSSNVP